MKDMSSLMNDFRVSRKCRGCLYTNRQPSIAAPEIMSRGARKRMPVSRSRKPSSADLATGAVTLGIAALAAPGADAATFTVTNLNDTGAGSLRAAIGSANASAGADVILFQAGLTGTIGLTTGQLDITDSVDIQGPGAATLTVSGSNSSRIFYLYYPSATIDVTISGLTVANGNASIGGGIVDFDENLTLDGVRIQNSHAFGDGGGLWADGFNMNLTIRNSTISGNVADSMGGGIYVEDTGGPLLIQDSVISGNQAGGSGGGIYFYDPDHAVTIDRTTISGNTAGCCGGGIFLYDTDGAEPLVISNSTISGNSGLSGGGLFLYGPDTEVLIFNTTISGNQATAGNGGGVYIYNAYSAVTFDFVTISGNTATGEGGG